jgi:uncharacterized coiled-coil DUF342 family protein
MTTQNEPTTTNAEEVTDSINYERLGRETASAELKRHAMRLRDRFEKAAMKIEEDELTEQEIEELAKELANAKVWVARIAEGRHLHAWEVLDE